MLLSRVSILVKFLVDGLVFAAQDLNTVLLGFIVHLLAVDFVLGRLLLLGEIVLLIVIFVFQGQEVLVQGNTVTEQRLIT